MIVDVYSISICVFFFFKHKTAYEMRISDWSSDVCSSDLDGLGIGFDLGDDRLLDLLRQAAAHAADTVAHVAGGDVGIGAEAEAHGDAALLRLAARDRKSVV